MEKINIGLIGLGTVGSGVVKTLNGFEDIHISKIAVRDMNKKRNIDISPIAQSPRLCYNTRHQAKSGTTQTARKGRKQGENNEYRKVVDRRRRAVCGTQEKGREKETFPPHPL